MNLSPVVTRKIESWKGFEIGQWVEFVPDKKIVRIVSITEAFDNPRVGFESYHSARFQTETMKNESGLRGRIEADFIHFSQLV